MRFHDPQLLAFLLLLLALLMRRRTRSVVPSIPFADGSLLLQLPETARSQAVRLMPWMQLLVLVLLVIALARPQKVTRETTVLTKAVDLMIALDLSSSMLAEDATQAGARKNRLAAAKEVLSAFVQKRSGDRVGLVAFAARPYSVAPLTLDHAWLKNAVARLQVGAVEDGTAVGDALVAALNRLRDKKAESRAVILISDGVSNTGTPPAQAAAAAAALGIRVYTVGIGSKGTALFPVDDPLGGVSYQQMVADLDETTLRAIASITGGRYFRADNQRGLELVFQDIDTLVKRPVEQKLYFSYLELFPVCITAALLLLLTDYLLSVTLLRRTP
jgi:Ca-activated chloride channel family protein